MPFPGNRLNEAAIAQVFTAFHDLHKAEYGHVFAHSPIEIVNIRLTGIGVMPKITPPRATDSGTLKDATTVAPPGTSLITDTAGNLIIRVRS